MKNRVAYFGVFTALALIFSYIETLVPISFGIPGVKLGLANLIIVIALYKIPLREVYVLSIVRAPSCRQRNIATKSSACRKSWRKKKRKPHTCPDLFPQK